MKTFVLSANLTFPRANGGGEQRDLPTFCSAFLAPTPGRPAARTLDFRICIPQSPHLPAPTAPVTQSRSATKPTTNKSQHKERCRRLYHLNMCQVTKGPPPLSALHTISDG